MVLKIYSIEEDTTEFMTQDEKLLDFIRKYDQQDELLLRKIVELDAYYTALRPSQSVVTSEKMANVRNKYALYIRTSGYETEYDFIRYISKEMFEQLKVKGIY